MDTTPTAGAASPILTMRPTACIAWASLPSGELVLRQLWIDDSGRPCEWRDVPMIDEVDFYAS